MVSVARQFEAPVKIVSKGKGRSGEEMDSVCLFNYLLFLSANA